MTGFKLDRFAGIVPRTPAALLPLTAATVAQNCDFAYGELRNTLGNLATGMLSNAAHSIYTDDGLLFYSWAEDVNAVRSPLANDTFNRLFYSTPTDIRVASRTTMTAGGGVPPTSYRVGVPRPLTAPTLVVQPAAPDLLTNAAVLPVHLHGVGNSTEYHAGTGQGISVGSVTMKLDAPGSVVAIVNYQSMSGMARDNFNTRVEVVADGKNVIAQSDSGLAGYALPHVASGAIALGAGSHIFYLSFGNDYKQGYWLLGQWSITLLAATVVGDVVATVVAADTVTRAYVYTLVNIYGEEGPPSPPAVFSFHLGTVSLGIDYTAPAIDYAPVKEIRIYRTPDASSIADYFYVGKISMLGSVSKVFDFVDSVTAAQLNEALASQNYYPPDPALIGLMSLPNGILMAWKGNELHFSDAYKPHSWPPAYVLTFGDYSIVGAIAVGASALVTTTGKPFMISGVSPDSMTNSVINVQQAGVSKWALADLGGQIVYASHDGIVVFDGGLPSLNFSDTYFTRDVWRARYGAGLATMRFAVWDGRLIVYSASGAFTAYMIGLDESRGAMTELPALLAQCNFVSPIADQCYLAAGTQLFSVANGAALQATWASREIKLPRALNYGIAQVICSGAWNVDFFANGTLRHSQSGLNGTVTFRLPGGFMSDSWMVRIEGIGIFKSLMVGETATDLKEL